MRRLRSTMLPLAFALVALVSSLRADSPDRALIRDTLKRMWDSVRTLEVHAKGFVCDQDGRQIVDGKKTIQKIDFYFGAGGRRAQKRVYVTPDGKVDHATNLREDGKKFYVVTPFEDDSESTDTILIQPQTDTPNHCKAISNAFTWLWTPDGRPLFSLIDEGASLTPGKDQLGREIVVLSDPKLRLSCELDPKHDWLAQKVSLQSGVDFIATGFRREKGIWFPVSGFETSKIKRENEAQHYGFQVETLRVNGELPESTFRITSVPEGAIVKDETGGKSYVKGGDESRKYLETKHIRESRSTNKSQVSAAPIVASQDATGFPWSVVLGTSSIVLLVAAWFLRSR